MTSSRRGEKKKERGENNVNEIKCTYLFKNKYILNVCMETYVV